MQHYKHHIRYYPPHHFIFYPLAGLLTIGAAYNAFTIPQQRIIWLFIAAIIMLCTWLSFMMRQHYALINQDRTVRLEMRFRYYVVTGERFELLEDKLSFRQIAALRFAADWELASLVKRTLREELTPDQIKQSIVNWMPDDMRV
jgi:hypothetical protein